MTVNVLTSDAPEIFLPPCRFTLGSLRFCWRGVVCIGVASRFSGRGREGGGGRGVGGGCLVCASESPPAKLGGGGRFFVTLLMAFLGLASFDMDL